jgi:hypothetical protein
MGKKIIIKISEDEIKNNPNDSSLGYFVRSKYYKKTNKQKGTFPGCIKL